MRRLGELLLVPDTYVGWIPFAAKAAIDLCGKESFDALYSTSPPDSTHIAAGRVADRFGIPWIADFRDPWINLYLRDPPTPLHRVLHRRLERRICAADRVLVTTSWQRETMLRLYPGARVIMIPNGYEDEDFSSSGPVPPAGDPLTILHCGMLTLGRSTRPLLEGLAVLLDRRPELRDRVRVRFIGPRESGNELWVARLGLEGVVEFEGNIPHVECIERERASHVLLLVKHDDPRYRGLVPGKLFEYIGARRPVLAVVPEGEAAGIVRTLRRGEVASISNPEEVAEKIEKMYRFHEKDELDEQYDLGVACEHSRSHWAGRLADELDSLMEEA